MIKLNTFKTSAVLFPLHYKPADSQYDGFDLFCHYIFDTDTKRARYLFGSLFSKSETGVESAPAPEKDSPGCNLSSSEDP